MTDAYLEIDAVDISYQTGRGLASMSRKNNRVVVSQASLAVKKGTTTSIVGESGAGKTSVGRAILRLTPITAGEIRLDGRSIHDRGAWPRRSFHKTVQAVFQDPTASLNRRMLVRAQLAEAVALHSGHLGRKGMRNRIGDLLSMVGLDQQHADRYPDELSGGQKQRVCLARALAPEPDLIVCDEATSALDVSTQNQLINLLEDLQKRLGLTLVFISHDLSIVRRLSHNVAVMQQGEIVEIGPTADVYDHPKHPYTKMLLQSMPRLNAAIERANRSSDSSPNRKLEPS